MKMAHLAIYLLIALDGAMVIWGQQTFPPPPPTSAPVIRNVSVGLDEGFIVLTESIIVNISCSLVIDQAIDEIPNPYITWFKDGISFSDRPTPNVEVSTDRRFCKIYPTPSFGGQLGNGGCYSCQVCDNRTNDNRTNDNRTNQNCIGSNDTCIAVCGYPHFEPPKSPPVVSPTIITLTCGQDVIVDNLVGVISLTIECIVYNGSEPFTFQVLKDGELIGNNFMLSFTPPTDNNFGTYTFTLSTEHCGNVTAVSRIIHQEHCSYAILSFSQATYRVNENNGPAQPVLVLSHAIDCCSTISVWVNIEEDTAKEGEDFIATSPVQVLFPGGHTRAAFDVRMVDNVMLEDSEKFIVSIDPLSLAYGVVLGDVPTAEVVILDDDEADVSFKEERYEVEEGDGHVELTLVLSQAVPFETSLELQNIDDTTTRSCDYEDGPYYLLIPAGVTTFKYNITILDDDVYEINETFTVEIASSNHHQIKIGDPDVTKVTIIDYEKSIAVSFSQTIFPVNERDGVIAPVLTLSKPSPCCLHLHVEVEDITATRGFDHSEVHTTHYNVTFPAGTSCSSFDIPIHNDTESEQDELFNITIMEMSLPFGTKLGDNITADVFIGDNDNYLNFSQSIYKIYEDHDGSMCVELTHHKPALFDVMVEVNETAQDAISGVDYEGGPYYVNITKGDMSAPLCVNIINDNVAENDESFMLKINTITLHHEIIPVHPVEAMVTIMDDEYTFYFDKPSYIVAEDEGFVLVNLTFSVELRHDTIVQFRYDDLTAIGNESNRTEEVPDYNVAYSWPNFDIVPKGSTFYTLNITIIPDRRLEDNELFRIYVDEPMTPIGMMPIQADVIIKNDDDFVIGFDSLSYAVNTKNQPDVPIIKFHSVPDYYDRDMFFPIDVIIREGAEGDTAIGGYTESEGDYVYQNYSYIFNSTADKQSVIIRPVDDNIVEPDEYFTLTFSLVGKPDHFMFVNETVTITIFNDDVCTVRIIEKDGRDTLYFSKELSTNVTVIISYNNGTGNQQEMIEFTAEETNTKNYYPLPNNINSIEVFVREDFLSRLPNLVSGDPQIEIIPVEPPVE